MLLWYLLEKILTLKVVFIPATDSVLNMLLPSELFLPTMLFYAHRVIYIGVACLVVIFIINPCCVLLLYSFSH